MNEVISLDETYSTTRRVLRAQPEVIAELIKQSAKPEDQFETQVFLSAGENRQAEGGLRTKGYFKVGGLISENLCHSKQSEESFNSKSDSKEESRHREEKDRHSREGGNLSSPLTESTSQEKPLITVVTVVYNGEQFLEETILSVINQTYDNVEYIIIDGGSTDGTLDIIRKYEHAIDYWVSEKDKGIYDAMNKGISLSSGSIIGILNSDDLLYNTDTLENIIDTYLLKNADVIYGDILLVNPKTKLVKEKRFAKIRKMAYGMYLNHPAIFISLSIYKRFGIFRSDIFKMAADYDLLLRILIEKVRFIYINKYLAVMRDGGVSIKSYDITIKETYIARKLNLSYIKFNLTNIVKCIKKYLA